MNILSRCAISVLSTLSVVSAFAQSDTTYMSMQKSNSTSFAIDGDSGGANRQNVYLWNYGSSNQNQHWEEVSRGGDYYSYKKRGTNFCLDGNHDGANGQNVYLWTCSDGNQNQHWKKIFVSGQYRLEKRNAPGYSLDGGRGGANGQNLYLWSSNNANQNQLWQFESHTDSVTETPPNSEDIVSHDFNDGNMGAFVACTVKNPNYAKVVNNRVETYWREDAYDGTRTARGAEFCDANRGDDELKTTDEGWMGFTLNIDESHSRNVNSGLAQIFQFDDSGFTWAGFLELLEGDLAIHHRTNVGTRATLIKDMEFGKDHDIIIQFKVSNQKKGKFVIWIDGELVYNAVNIDFGFGQFNSDGQQYDQTYITYKLGMYNHESEGYEDNEIRIVYYDNVTWYSGTNGYDIVDPD